MPETNVDLIVREQGANRAAAAMDRLNTKTTSLTKLAPSITALGSGLSGLGQVARLLGPEFDKLGQSISNIGISAAGLGSLGQIFGPVGAAIGTGIGALVGILNEFVMNRDDPAAGGAGGGGAPQVRVENQISMTAELTGETLERNLREIVDNFEGPLAEVRQRTEQTIDDALRRSRNAATAFIP